MRKKTSPQRDSYQPLGKNQEKALRRELATLYPYRKWEVKKQEPGGGCNPQLPLQAIQAKNPAPVSPRSLWQLWSTTFSLVLYKSPWPSHSGLELQAEGIVATTFPRDHQPVMKWTPSFQHNCCYQKEETKDFNNKKFVRKGLVVSVTRAERH